MDTAVVPLNPIPAATEVVLSLREGRGGALSCWIARPPGALANPAPVVAVHGVQRGALDLAQHLGQRAATLGRVLVAPVFDATNWHGYQRAVQPRRADLALLALLRELQCEGLWDTPQLDLFGYSGGAQFCHRFAMLYPQMIRRLIVAAAGWYTFPDQAAYPYGLGTGRGNEWGPRLAAGLDRFLRLPIQVCVGQHDDVPDEQTRRHVRLDAQQGDDRVTRARRWVQALRRQAVLHGLRSRVTLSVMPACGHDFVDCVMRGGLADHVFGTRGAEGTATHAQGPVALSCLDVHAMATPSPRSTAVAASAKWAFTTRRVRVADAVGLLPDVAAATPGDLVLCRVEQVGSHKKLQLAVGRPSVLYRGDLVVLACGARYAPDQFEGLAEVGPGGADMLASGGVVGRMRHRHASVSRPTRLIPLGLLADAHGTVLNLDRYALPARAQAPALPVIGVVGTSMNAGKTTTVAGLARGLSLAGYRVAAIKATGTGAYGDLQAYADAGAVFTADFTDAGMVSTYRQPIDRIANGLFTVLSAAVDEGCDVAVVELADGVLQHETASLLTSPWVRAGFAGFLFAAPDALAAAGGCAALRAQGIEPWATTGMVSLSPLGTREAEKATGVRVMTQDTLCDPAVAATLLARAQAGSPMRVAA